MVSRIRHDITLHLRLALALPRSRGLLPKTYTAYYYEYVVVTLGLGLEEDRAFRPTIGHIAHRKVGPKVKRLRYSVHLIDAASRTSYHSSPLVYPSVACTSFVYHLL